MNLLLLLLQGICLGYSFLEEQSIGIQGCFVFEEKLFRVIVSKIMFSKCRISG